MKRGGNPNDELARRVLRGVQTDQRTDGSLLCQGGSGADAAGTSVSDDYVGWADPRNDEILFTWEEKNPELVKQRQKRQKEKLEMALISVERMQKDLDERRAKGIFTEEDELTQKSLDFDREYYTTRIEGATKMGI